MSFAIVIPCFNEAKRFLDIDYTRFLKEQESTDTALIFVNDGSKDNTSRVLQTFKDKFPNQVRVLNLETNLGKANAVRAGVLYALNNFKDIKSLAFLDADLATSLDECFALNKLIENDTSFVFGSRIKKIDNQIERKLYRHLLGRVIATFISASLNMSVYDSQCGCKVFSKKLAEYVFQKPFMSKWLFDVEIFFRIKEKYGLPFLKVNTREVPLQKWIDKDGSKVSITYCFRVWYDLYRIKKHHAKFS